MKHLLFLPIVIACCLLGFTAGAQDQPEQLNLPGDNLNLYAVMKLFQDSPTLEEFEKKLNDESNKINNLDLNGDNQIDYIKVVDNIQGDIHNIALKVAVNDKEDQDVAVFVVKKTNGQVDIQLIGDEALYGKDYIIEPNTGNSTPTANPGYTGNQPPPPPEDGEVYAASSWPVIQYIYVPTYSVWRSPWHWGYYPTYWHPWTPFYWHEYYGYQYHFDDYYRSHYRYTPVYRFPAWREHYYGGGYRSSSTVVSIRFSRGDYRQTYTRPDLANRGSDLFRKDHPQARSVNKPLPEFDRNNNNRPIVNRPGRDNRPGGDNANNNRPGNNENNGRPVTPAPGNGNTGNRPGGNSNTRPAPNNGNNAGNGNNRPVMPTPGTLPGNGNSGNGNNTPNRPYTGNNFPKRPGSIRPANGGNTSTARPVIPVVTPQPNNGNNNRPAPRPFNPPNNNNRPAGNNMPNRPVVRPSAPPRQQQPAGRPAPERQPRDHH